MHVTSTTGIEEEIFAVSDPKFTVAPSADRVGDLIGYFGGHVELEGIFIHDFFNVINERIGVTQREVVIAEIIDPGLGRVPMNMKVEHFVEWDLTEVG